MTIAEDWGLSVGVSEQGAGSSRDIKDGVSLEEDGMKEDTGNRKWEPGKDAALAM